MSINDKLPLEQSAGTAIKIYIKRLIVLLSVALVNYILIGLALPVKSYPVFSLIIMVALLAGVMVAVSLHQSTRKTLNLSSQSESYFSDPQTILKQRLALFQNLIERENISIRVDMEPSRLDISPSPLIDALDSLINNAIKYSYRSKSSSISRPIEIKGRRKGSFYEITIESYGIGIKAEEIASIKEGFYRGNIGSNINRSDAGIGLALAKQIIEAHEGTISVESREAGSLHLTKFEIKIPIAKTEEKY